MSVIDALRRRTRGLDAPDGGAVELLHAAAVLSPESMGIITPSGQMLYINRETEGFAPVDPGSSVWDYIAPDEHERTRACYAEVVRTKSPATYYSTAQSQSGEGTVFRTRVGPVLVGDEVVALVIIAADLTSEQQSDRALRDSEEQLRFAIEASGMGIWAYDVKAARIELDDRISAVAGLPAGGPRDLDELAPRVPSGDRRVLLQALQRCVESGVFEDVEHRVLRDDGTVAWLHTKGRSERDASGAIVRIVGGSFDVTAQVEEAERRDRAQKLEAVGQLAAGVAHNFNNVLASIQLNLEVALRRTPDDVKPLLRDALEAGQRAAELVRDLLRFAGRGRKGDLREVESLPEVVDRVASLCRQTFSSTVSIDVRHGDEIPQAMFAVAQVEQMVLNLCINAQHALEVVHRERPTLTIETDALSADEPEIVARIGDTRLASVYLRLRVSDNGCGMTEETQARLFEPFFTTKEPGRGTGLGLATVYSTARDHGGWVACESRLGEGTSFSAYLPARKPPATLTTSAIAPEPRTADRAPSSPPQALAGASGGAEVILVADEDALGRTAMARALRDVGYLVEEVVDVAAAIDRIERGVHGTAAQIDLLLLNRAVEGVGGNVVSERLMAIAAGSSRVPPAIIVVDDRDGPEADARPRLLKPITRRELLAAVRRELDLRVATRATSVDGPGTSW